MWWLYLPLIIVGLVLILFLLLILLGRFRNGALLKPVIRTMSRIGFMQRFFTSVSTKAIERQNPELASAIKKLNPVASNPNPQAVQKAMSRLTPAERPADIAGGPDHPREPGRVGRPARRRPLGPVPALDRAVLAAQPRLATSQDPRRRDGDHTRARLRDPDPARAARLGVLRASRPQGERAGAARPRSLTRGRLGALAG